MSKITVKKLSSYDKVIDCMSDKSMSIRSVLFNAYGVGSATVKNLLLSDDVLSAIDCVRSLGAAVELDGTTAHITGTPFSGATLDCGNSGTTARLLIGLLSGLNGVFTLTGDESLSSRPMRRVTEPLKEMGANITDTDGHLPVRIVGAPLHAIDYTMPVASAQVKSAILLAGLNAEGLTTVNEPVVSRNHTENMLSDMNARISRSDKSVSVERSIVYCKDFTVGGDISSAAYPLCLALMIKDGKCTVKNVGINNTRTGLLDVFENIGANVTLDNIRSGAEPTADVTVKHGPLRPFTIGGELIPRLVDEIPALCALACFIDGTSVVKDAHELKVKETDRISTTVAALKRLGADIEATDDGMVIHGGKPLRFGTADSKLDHRIAMSAAIAGAAGEGAEIDGAECASVSYPDFYDEVLSV